MFANFSLSQLALHLGDRTMARECGQIVLEFARQLHSTTWAAKAGALLQELEAEVPPRGPARPLPDGETLSARELEILRLLKSDLTGPEIADQLVVSLNTVRFHTKNIYQKLGVNTRLEAIRRAAELGL
jgi:ATP/maltotriose-dependent transcriptional regulator MalT